MTQKTFPIHFMITGGTIDSYDRDILYPLVQHGKSTIPSYIKSLKLDNKTKFTIICLKDSRDISKKDIQKLLNNINKSTSKHIIVTCGTFALSDMSRLLELNNKKKDKTIVLTGSMIPIYGFPMSDGPFNLGYAVSKVQELPKGVYVCMNGNVFSSNEIVKIVTEGKFASIFEEK